MIIKVIAVFSNGGKIIREGTGRLLKGIKLNGERPHLIQIFTDDGTYTAEDVADYHSVAHPVHGKITVDGEYP